MSSYQAWRRIVLGIIIALICLFLVFTGSLNDEPTHERIEMLGLALMLTGIGGRLWSTLYIGGRKSAEVVTTGPYSIMRNPLYFFSTLASVGVGAQTGTLAVTVIVPVLCACAFYIVTLREERYLTARLGASYRSYRASVPRFFPKPWLFRDDDHVTFRPHLLNRTLLDGLVFLLSIPFFELIEQGQQAGWIPVLFWIH
ncbi:isoprenylcysteine carboxylmethyltransferase family protein [Phyllobacterium sp. 21LDTY02-6]|uniref:methyltransferase family protein n=1 Tax=Phyllobacterium sp. 21LDTY02-6 TaxID=2944903 RepID=UPI002021F715|nr:isoprenylcysteine carboxylmethyltransferase family protein [Phyllobacterium sp. 21LDTY02-6]MCO4318027.1 isoprenylcysteine carboxylmethyltransferase family protein [Phyllobacterium sp. 21LDTY02-6]